MDNTRLKLPGADGLQYLMELLQLTDGLRVPHFHGVELGINSLQRHIRQGAVSQQNFLRLAYQKAPKPHPGVHLDMGAGHRSTVFRQCVQGQTGVYRRDCTHYIQVYQLLQFLPVGGGAEHEDLLVHKTGLPQGLSFRHVVDRETTDALCPEQLGHGHDAGTAAVAGEYPIDNRPCRPLLDYGQIVLHCRFINNQLTHKVCPPDVRGLPGPFDPVCGCALPIHVILPLSGENSNVAIRE